MTVHAQNSCTLSHITDVQAVYTYYYLASSDITSNMAPKDNVNAPGASTIRVTYNGVNYDWTLTEPTLNIVDDVIQTAVGKLYFMECTLFSDSTYDWGPLMTSSTYAAAKAAYNLSSQALANASAAKAVTDLMGGHFIYGNAIPNTSTSAGARVIEQIEEGDVDLTTTPSKWHHNVNIGANGIQLRYNEAVMAQLAANQGSSANTALKFYKPPTISGNTTTQGALTMELSTSGLTFYDGSSINGGNIQAQFGSSGAIQSGDYAISAATNKFSTYGTKIDLVHGEIYSPYFRLSQGSVSGGPVAGIYMSGTFESTGALIGYQKTSNSDTDAYWKIGYMTDTNQDRLTYQRGNSIGFIELAPSSTFILQKNKLHTAWFGNNGYLTYPQFSSKYYDFGLNLPTSLNDKFLYIRYNSGSNLSTIYQNDSGWTYPFYIDGNGAAYAQNFYKWTNGSWAPIDSGTVSAAGRLTTGAGSSTQPVYFPSTGDNAGQPVATTYQLNAAGAKGIDTSMPTTATDNNVPTTKLMKTFVEGKGYITGYTETDPTVPSWAKASTKPSYDLSEISNTSDLQAIEGLTGTSGFLKKTAANTWSLDTATYLTSSSTLNAAKLSGAIPSAVTATTQASTDNSTKIATTAYVTTAIANLPEPMLFKGSVGSSGTVTWANLATAAAANEGWTYKVITAHTAETGKPAAKVGDTIISNGSEWVVIPSGDEPSGTVTSIILKAGNGITLDVDNTAITDSGTRTISHADTSSQNSVTASSRRYITAVTLDAYGHVTGLSTGTETVTDTHHIANLVNGSAASGTNAMSNKAVTSGNVYLNLIEGASGSQSIRNSHKLIGGNGLSITSNTDGDITFTSPSAFTGVSFDETTGVISFTKSGGGTATITTDDFVITQATGATGLVGTDADHTPLSVNGPVKFVSGVPETMRPTTPAGQFLKDDGTWATPSGTYSLPLAASDTRGGIKIGFTTSAANRNYAVALSSEKAYVNVPWTDRYVNSASFADDTTNSSSSPVKMTLTRAGSDTNTITANIPKVSSSSAGVAPKGNSVNSQSQSTRFLREDGTWAAPSYTTNTNTATAADDILDGSNVGTEIKYAPYTSRQNGLSLYTGTTAPNGTTRLNLNGYLYATKLYSGGTEVLTSHQDLSNYKTKQTAISAPTATTNKWVNTLAQNANGEITVTYTSLDTSGTWSGNATTATTATKLGSTTVGGTGTPIYLDSGTPKAITSALSVSLGGTGTTSFTSGAVLIGNGSSAIQTRSITNQTSGTVTASTNLITANSLVAHVANVTGNYVAKTGDTMTGTLIVPELQAAKIKADDVNVTHLLTAEGIQTKNWTAVNMATIDGSFYIVPTVSIKTEGGAKLSYDSGTITLVAQGSNTFATNSLYITGDATSWTTGSLIMITGSVKIGQEFVPIGTIKGTLTGVNTTRITFNNLSTDTGGTPNILNSLSSGHDCKDLKISIYSYKNNNHENLLGIMMTTAGTKNRTYIDIYDGTHQTNGKTESDGLTTYTEPVVRIGNLRGLPNTRTGDYTVDAFLPTGWGIYTTNGFFQGTIAAERGYLASGVTIGTGSTAPTIETVKDSATYYVEIEVRAIDYSVPSATLFAHVYYLGTEVTTGLSFQWKKIVNNGGTYTTQIISGQISQTLSVLGSGVLDTTYICEVDLSSN